MLLLSVGRSPVKQDVHHRRGAYHGAKASGVETADLKSPCRTTKFMPRFAGDVRRQSSPRGPKTRGTATKVSGALT
jgi:hypothetical protein